MREQMLLSAICAGILISFGCMANLSTTDHLTGAVLFGFGLLFICTRNRHLFTGKVCYPGEVKVGELILIWIGNFLGVWTTASLVLCTRIGSSLAEYAKLIAETKYNDQAGSLIALGIFCNICIYLAVDGYRRTSKYLPIFIGVTVFVFCGFEHCVADMFYLILANNGWPNIEGWKVLGLVTLGNAAGGALIGIMEGAIEKCTTAQ